MANYNFILNEFGLQNLKPKEYKLSEAKDGDVKHNYAKPDIILPRSYDEVSLLGTPVFSRLEIKAGSYFENGKEIKFNGLKTEEGTQIDAVLFDVNQAKNIITTAIQGRNGTVKEYISEGDYQINIKGILVNGDNAYPEEQVNNLIKMCKAPVALEVSSWYLQLFGIFSIVIDSYSIPQRIGATNFQAFELNCLSDTPIELLKKEEL